MPKNILRRPGIARGFYPENKIPKEDWFDHFLSHGSRLTQQHLKSRNRKINHFINEVNKYEKPIKRFNDLKLSHIIKTLKSELIRDFSDEKKIAKSFAIIKEVAHRTLGMPHYDVQLIGGWIMINGMLAEMQTGEGKTLTATLPACTAAMAGIPVHIISVNDYLVTRDAQLMKPIYDMLGLSVGTITENMDPEARRLAYACDITYCTSKQLIFDYLKDRLVFREKDSDSKKIQLESLYSDKTHSKDLLMRGLCFAIIDEADSVLIDEARTPLILSKPGKPTGQETVFHQALNLSEKFLEQEDFHSYRQSKSIEITIKGEQKLEALSENLSSFWKGKKRRIELLKQVLSAKLFYIRDQHYLVHEGKIQIIDENTGRPAPDRKWDRGLHQLIEIKENCAITNPTEIVAKITNQRFFRRYLKLSGMTGTANEVSTEMWRYYRLGILSVPLHKPSRRIISPVKIQKNSKKKWASILKEVKTIHQNGTPILLATSTVKTSELLSEMLSGSGLPHQVLNARQNQKEAEVVSKAGNFKQITIATNMAGRGTDIKLAPGVSEIGGLHVILCEPNLSQRIDRQIIGRCGRQGDPGSVSFFYSLDDEVIQIYRSKKLFKLPVYSNNLLVTKAQKSIERHHQIQRQALLKEDQNIGTLLAFSGSFE
ncbi:MAG: preprotein translocase subunit SecA [Gammaproteobacteria bacterium]